MTRAVTRSHISWEIARIEAKCVPPLKGLFMAWAAFPPAGAGGFYSGARYALGGSAGSAALRGEGFNGAG
jgi:hypothetical protein